MPFDEEYYKSDEFRELLDSYEAATASGGHPFMDADDLVDIADYYNYCGDFSKAVDVVDHALQLYPSATLPNVFKAREALMDDDFEVARQYAEAIESKSDPDYHYLVAEIMIAEGRTDEADSYLRDYARSVEADEYQDFVKDCANLYVDYGVNDKAYEWMMRSKNDDSDDFKELMARALFGLGKYKDSGRIFNELIDHNPFSKTYWNALANAQFMDEDYNASITSSEYAIAIDPNDPEGLASKANGLFRLGDYEGSLEYYRRYSRLAPDDGYGLLQQGLCLLNLNRYEEAEQPLLEALRISYDEPAMLAAIYQELAFCYSAKRQPQKAMEMLDKTVDLPCDHNDMEVIRGHILLENGLRDDAIKAFSKAMLVSEGAPAVMLRIIVSLYDNHYINSSYVLFKRLLKYTGDDFPELADWYAYMALCCYDLQKYDEFLHYLQLAVDRSPSEARKILVDLFPADVDVKDYPEYMKGKLSV